MIILEYHEIVSSEPGDVHAVQATRFAEQMSWLQENDFNVVQLSEWIQARRKLKPAPNTEVKPQKTIAITFDDGYRDNLTNALPILKRYDYPATIFLISGFLGSTSLWRQGPLGQTPMLTWEEASIMLQSGIEFGSHTVTHADLTSLDQATVVDEVRRSRDEIEDRLGKPVILFSYPYSRYTNRVKDCVQQAGYLAACTYQSHYVGHAGQDLYELQRIGILAHDRIEDFAAKVNLSLPRRMFWYRASLRRWLRGKVLSG